MVAGHGQSGGGGGDGSGGAHSLAVLLWDKPEAQWRHCACERVEPTGRVPDWEDASLSLSFGSAELGSDTSRWTAAEF